MIINYGCHCVIAATDLNECTDSGLCNKNARCINTEGSYECQCHDGFQGNGYNCTGILTIAIMYCVCMKLVHDSMYGSCSTMKAAYSRWLALDFHFR